MTERFKELERESETKRFGERNEFELVSWTNVGEE